MSEIDAEATTHRTLDIGIAKLPYNLVDLPENYADVFRKAGARTAYTFRDKKVAPIMYRIKSDQDFVHFATRWERLHSSLIHGEGRRTGKVFPFVNEDGVIIGHIGEFATKDFYAPVGGETLTALVKQGAVFIDKQPGFAHPSTDDGRQEVTTQEAITNMAWAARKTQNAFKGFVELRDRESPETIFTVIADQDGYVQQIVSSRTTGGLVPVYYSPADLIAVPRLVLLLGRVTAKRIILALVRRRARRDLARGAARELAAGATKPLKPSLPITENPTYVNVGRPLKPGNIIADVKVEEGEITYRVSQIYLRGEEETVRLARACHREMIKRAAQQAKKAGKQRFRFYGVSAGPEFRQHADKLAREIGIPGSGKVIKNKGSPFQDYSVTLLVEKVLR